MKKLTSLLIGCSLALAGAALAQQPVEQQSPPKGKHAPEKTHATEAQPKANAAKSQAPPATQHEQHGAIKEHGATHEHGAMNEHGATNEHGAANEPPRTNVSGQPVETQTPSAKERIEQRRKGMKGPAAEAKTSTNPAAPPAAAGGAPSGPAGGQQNVQANAGAKAKKPDPQQVQQIKSQHAGFRAQPKPEQVPPVTFNESHRIEGADHWQGHQYEVFRSYHPERHDEGWYHSHYSRVELIGGGYYFFNNGYWFPAWGYSPSAEYYAYDGPIYVGQRAEPPDRVIADVQGELQQMGYYKGEVDGLLGPLTREALAAYQADQGLTTTEVIDEPTLDSLGLA
ncbi:MAG: peptidoglycan-binding domain-containing protein [Candidatus Udaeobacter sp.]